MRLNNYRPSAALALAFSGILVLAASALRTAGQSTTPGPDWDALVKGLASEDFTVRESVQKELDSVPRSLYPELKRRAAQATDPEVRSRLTVRLTALDDEIAFDPWPINLKVTDAPLPDVAAALSQAVACGTGADRADYARLSSIPRFTLDATDMPFWDVFLRLSAQHPLTIPAGDLVLWPSDTTGVRRGLKVGGFFVWARSATRAKEMALYRESGAEQSDNLSLRIQLAADPRICLIAARPLRILQAVDELNNVLYTVPPQADSPFRDSSEFSSWHYIDAPLALHPRHGAKVASISGVGEFVIGAGEVRVEVPDIKRWTDPVNVDGETVAMKLIKIEEGEKGGLALHIGQGNRFSLKPGPLIRRPVTVKLIDAAGRELWHRRIRQGGHPELRDIPITLPVTAVLTVPPREVTVKVPFEFKDLPLPYPIAADATAERPNR